MRHVRHTTIAILALIVSLAPVAAMAAPDVPRLDSIRAATAVAGTERTFIVSGTLPGDVELPATVVLPIPKGSEEPEWVGEILGGDPSADPNADYSIDEGDEYDTITITLKKSRTAQAEFFTTVSAPQGPETTVDLSLPIIGKVGRAKLEYWVPKGSTIGSTSKGIELEAAGSNDYDVYSVTKKSPKQGSTISGTVVFAGGASTPNTGGAAAGAAPASGGGGGSVSWQGLLGLAIVVAVAGSIGYFGVNTWMAWRERGSASGGAAATAGGPTGRPSGAAPARRSSTATKRPPAQPRADTTPSSGTRRPKAAASEASVAGRTPSKQKASAQAAEKSTDAADRSARSGSSKRAAAGGASKTSDATGAAKPRSAPKGGSTARGKDPKS